MDAIARRAAPAAFALALFASAALIFTVQPLIGRLLTPLLGGSPAVWNTSMAFFQGALLAGYVYAHAVARLRDLRAQAGVHALALALAFVALPIHVSGLLGAPNVEHPALWLIGVLALSIGLPFAVASATAPLLQAWYARTGRADANDPFYLYAASNLGSFVGLIAYPVLVEPNLGLDAQAWAWTLGYGAVVALIGVAAALALAARGAAPPVAESREPITWSRRLVWLGASAAPSALVLGATQHLATDIASAPFLWVWPLALYLLTFVIAFARGGERASPLALVAHPLALAVLIASYFTRSAPILAISANLACLFFSALVCHLALARARPSAARLTEFYFFVSAGGVAGGAAAALLAPAIFNDIYEYPLALAAVALLRPLGAGVRTPLANALAAAAIAMTGLVLFALARAPVQLTFIAGGVGAAATLFAAAVPQPDSAADQRRQGGFMVTGLALALAMTVAIGWPDLFVTGLRELRDARAVQPAGFLLMALTLIGLGFCAQAAINPRSGPHGLRAVACEATLGVAAAYLAFDLVFLVEPRSFTYQTLNTVAYAAVALAVFANHDRPRAMAALTLTAFLVVFVDDRGAGQVLRQERSFFGVLRAREVTAEGEAGATSVRVLLHGTTLHGAQLRGSTDAEKTPITYYNASSALGESILAALSVGEANHVALIGLGAGTTACLLQPEDKLTIFEIDPAVVRLSAGRAPLFTFVSRCQPQARIVIGDARLRIAAEPSYSFDVILVDAFSSDAIPAHLLTREAIATYLDKLTERGVLVLHLSNLNLALVAEAARVAQALDAPYVWRLSARTGAGFAGQPASAMIVARTPEALAALPLASTDWAALPRLSGRPWSDDYVNLPRAFRESFTGFEACLEARFDTCGGAMDHPK